MYLWHVCTFKNDKGAKLDACRGVAMNGAHFFVFQNLNFTFNLVPVSLCFLHIILYVILPYILITRQKTPRHLLAFGCIFMSIH